MPRPDRRIAWALLLAAALPASAFGGPAENAYIAARDKYVAAIAAAEKAGANNDAVFKQDERARADLEKQMTALLGPLAFKGLEKKPSFSPGALYDGDMESGRPDGLLFHDVKYETRIFVSPEPVLANWVGHEAENLGLRAGEGLEGAFKSDPFYTQATGSDAAFQGYVDLPLSAQDGETLHAALGVFAQDDVGNAPPNAIVIGRLSAGRVSVGTIPALEAFKFIPACTKVWKDFESKANALFAAVQKGGKGADDPRWDKANALRDEGSAAVRACYAREMVTQPQFAAVLKKAEALLQKMRGN
ncbi:hypothetical protein V5G24_14805 [Xanthobacter sp. VTT E-85241]|uniref:hypothetical protein n=1 Tax=Roseixanthobacter finlandensis TaxID=3119922 RepID=UPI00372A41A6